MKVINSVSPSSSLNSSACESHIWMVEPKANPTPLLNHIKSRLLNLPFSLSGFFIRSATTGVSVSEHDMMWETVKYYLSEHSAIVNFRWSHAHCWGSTWSFLVSAVAAYVASASVLHLLLLLLLRRRRVPLGPLPALHSLAVASSSALIFSGMLLSSSAEIRDTRWLWRRSRSPLQWLLCFPLGTRPSGRVFFWSYAFYLSRSLHLLRSFIIVLHRRRLSPFHLLNQSVLLCTSFLWLEFSQSFQVLAILSATLFYVVLYGYRFWSSLGLHGKRLPSESFVVNCQVALLGYNLVGHLGVLFLHLLKGGGCNGIGAACFNSVLNCAILFLVLKFYVTVQFKQHKNGDGSRLID